MNNSPNLLNKSQIRHIEHVKNYVGKAICQYQMIENGDKVLVAVSGGKDSLVLLDALAAYQKYSKISFQIEALHVNVTDVPYAVDRDFLTYFTSKIDVPIHFIDIEANIGKDEKKSPCFVCSRHRRKALFVYANTHGFKKLALGHHQDDAVETLLINMAYHANISALPGKLSMFKGELFVIRPLIMLTNSDTSYYTRIKQFKPINNSCPYEDKTKRATARYLIKAIEVLHPKARTNLLKSLKNIDHEYLP